LEKIIIVNYIRRNLISERRIINNISQELFWMAIYIVFKLFKSSKLIKKKKKKKKKNKKKIILKNKIFQLNIKNMDLR